jgi:hypothetical protein
MERGDDTWRGIPDRLVKETYVSRHSSMYMFFGARTHKSNVEAMDWLWHDSSLVRLRSTLGLVTRFG